jgi:hypothetical protein
MVNCDHLLPAKNVIVIVGIHTRATPREGIKGGELMLWTVFMLFMFACMLVLIVRFGLGAIPLVIVLASVAAFIKLIRRPGFQWRRAAAPRREPERSTKIRIKRLST